MTGSNASPDLTTPASTIAQGQDSTERKRVDEAWRESESGYRASEKMARMGHWRRNYKTDTIFWSEGVLDVFGLPPGGAVPRFDEFLALVHPEDRAALRQAITEALAGGRALDVEYRIQRPDGELRHIHTRGVPVRGASGEFDILSGILQDITERKRAVEDLRESEERFRTLFSQAPIGVAIDGPDGRYLDANDAFYSMFGYSKEELRRKKVLDIIHPDDRGAFLKTDISLLSGAIPGYTAERRYVRKDGSFVFVHVVTRAVHDSDGEFRYRIAMIEDITERKLAEERTRRLARELLVVRENERQQVSSALHHDVGSLAVGISAHFDAIEEDLRCGNIEEALKRVKRTRELFDESVGRLKGLATQLRPPELDVLGLPAALRQYFSQATECGDTRIHFRETLGQRRVTGDAASTLFRIAQEALTNAISHGHAKRVDVSLKALKKEVGLTVSDNGKGFDPPEGGARETSQIGLHTMKEMTALAGGVFEVDSAPGKGTTVRVSLPLETAVFGPVDATAPKETAGRGKTFHSAGQRPRPRRGSQA